MTELSSFDYGKMAKITNQAKLQIYFSLYVGSTLANRQIK